MMAKTHMIFGAATWVTVGMAADATGVSGAAGFALGTTPIAAFGALLPDVDHPESSFGRRVSIISIPLSAMLGHRGFTHSLAAVGVFSALLAWSAVNAGGGDMTAALAIFIVAPLSVGYLSHLLGDALTVSGVPLMWPKRRLYKWPLFRTGSARESVFRALLTAGCVAAAVAILL